jgi:hypothetical protein
MHQSNQGERSCQSAHVRQVKEQQQYSLCFLSRTKIARGPVARCQVWKMSFDGGGGRVSHKTEKKKHFIIIRTVAHVVRVTRINSKCSFDWTVPFLESMTGSNGRHVVQFKWLIKLKTFRGQASGKSDRVGRAGIVAIFAFGLTAKLSPKA